MIFCTRCKQGSVLEVFIPALAITGFVCNECEALWFKKEEISPSGFVDYGTFMQSKGLKGLWTDLIEKR